VSESAEPRALRVLHAPRNVAAQASDLAAAQRRLGHHVEIWEDGPNPFGWPSDRQLGYEARDPRLVWDAVKEAAERFDVIHFHFGRTLVPTGWSGLPLHWDLPVYRALGIRVFFTFHGSDVRIGRMHTTLNPWSHLRAPGRVLEDDRLEKSLQVIKTYATGMFVVSANNLVYLPQAEYLPRIIDLRSWPERPVTQRERPVVIHAPSRRATKGTDTVLEGLDALRAEGIEFDLHLLEGVPHEVVREALADGDILVDNLVAGAYGIVSLEAMASGMVTIANLSDDVRQAHPDAPVVDADPHTFRDVMRALIRNLDDRRRLAELGRPFVARVHDADVIAARLAVAYARPAGGPPARSMPDWASYAPKRRIEQLEDRIATLEDDLAGTHRREADLRARLGLPPTSERPPSRLRRIGRRMLPTSVRRRLRRRFLVR
jgi:glycosyltransferase involved in cell wall biosynthesis